MFHVFLSSQGRHWTAPQKESSQNHLVYTSLRTLNLRRHLFTPHSPFDRVFSEFHGGNLYYQVVTTQQNAPSTSASARSSRAGSRTVPGPWFSAASEAELCRGPEHPGDPSGRPWPPSAPRASYGRPGQVPDGPRRRAVTVVLHVQLLHRVGRGHREGSGPEDPGSCPSRTGTEAAEQLGLGAGSKVVEVSGFRSLDGTPVMNRTTSFVPEVGRLLFDFRIRLGLHLRVPEGERRGPARRARHDRRCGGQRGGCGASESGTGHSPAT